MTRYSAHQLPLGCLLCLQGCTRPRLGFPGLLTRGMRLRLGLGNLQSEENTGWTGDHLALCFPP